MATATSDFELAGPSVGGIVASPSGKDNDEDKPEGDVKKRRKKFDPKAPSDFEDAEEFLHFMRTTYDKDLESDKKNRDEMVMDARFMSGDQWDSAVKQRRDDLSKPTLTINRMPAYVAQLVGNRRMNDVGIKVIPDMGGTKKIADIREGLIRSIQKISRAQYAYDKAFEQQVIGGLGNFQVHLDYAQNDVFEQDIRIVAIPNPLAVVWDQGHVDPSGSDAAHVFVTDRMSRRDFKKKYPDANATDWSAGDSSTSSYGWDTSDSVQVVSFWRMRTRQRVLAMMNDSSVQDVTDIPEEQWFDLVADDENGAPVVRDVSRRYAQMYLCTSQDILNGPYELPITRVPVFRVPGWELFIEGDRIRWGLLRFLRDPQKLHNYWRSTIAEKLVGAPKAKWVATAEALEGREDAWRKSHLDEDPVLLWNGDSGSPPVRVPPMEMEAALIDQAGVASQDMRDVSNVHEASLGMQSNEVSGKAISARQRVSELGSVIYQDNLNTAIEEAGLVINQLIPFVYDTPRIIKVLGPDMVTEKQVKINYSGDPESEDISVGKYAVTVTTGPSYTTRRVEAREEMMAMVNSMPQTMAVAADKIVEAQDWPGADEIARRLRTQLPPGMISETDLSEEEQKAAQQQQQAAQQQDELKQLLFQLQVAEGKAKIAVEEAKAAESQARARESMANADLAEARTKVALASIETDHLKAAAAMAGAMNKDRQYNGA
ncbi:MAG: portal protein [Bryobacteraceae bacterium]